MTHTMALKVILKIDSLSKVIILVKYLDYTNIFLPKFIAKFLEHSNDDHAIKPKKAK